MSPSKRDLVAYTRSLPALEQRVAELELGLIAAEEALEVERAFRCLVENSADALALCAPEGWLQYASPSMQAIVGYTPEELAGKDSLGQIHPDDASVAREKFDALLNAPGEAARIQVRLRHRDGSWRWTEIVARNLLHDPRLKGLLCNYRDVTEAKRLEEQLAHQATHDPLTGLPNRRLFEDRLQQAIAYSRRSGQAIAVVYLDIDGFKVVNDSLGHSTGDLLLVQVTERLKRLIRETDTLARTGGDEFILVASQLRSPDGARTIVQKLLSAFLTPFQLGPHELFVTASAGISLFPYDGETVDTLQRKADLAMYDSKRRGKNAFMFFNPEMSAESSDRLKLENDLRRALEREQLVLYYQPQFDLERKAVIGAEALLRWKHPELGMIPPNRFIPIAEETGLIVSIGQWVLQEACRQCSRWHSAGARIAVNVSALQFSRADFVSTVAASVEQAGLRSEQLELELTESLLMHRIEETAARMSHLRALGVRISLDDFGTGYSSLSQLQRLPIDSIKIDRSFLKDMDAGSTDVSLIGSIVGLAHSMGMNVVAEGIETQKQLDALRAMGCDHGQGFLMGRPVPPDEIGRFMEGARLPRGKTILLVEDEEAVLMLARRVLKQADYEVLDARNGRDAVTICKRNNAAIDLLITDLVMPGLSGEELAKELERRRPDLPVIYISGYSDGERVTSMQHSWFLAKPFQPQSLLKLVEEALQTNPGPGVTA